MVTKHLSESDMFALMFGEATEEIESHLAQCERCQQVYATLDALDALLEERLYRLHCPAPETLACYVEGRLPARQADMVARHVARCVPCRREVEAITPFVGPSSLRLSGWLEVFANGIRRVFRAYPMPSAAPQPVRGGRPVMQRYKAPGMEILISRVESADDSTHVLVGQLLIPEPSVSHSLQGLVILVTEEGREARYPLDKHGGFVLSGVPPGRHRLRFDLEAKPTVELFLTV